MLHRKLNQKQIVDHRKGKNRGIQERNEEKSGSAERARKAYDLCFPNVELRRQGKLASSLASADPPLHPQALRNQHMGNLRSKFFRIRTYETGGRVHSRPNLLGKRSAIKVIH